MNPGLYDRGRRDDQAAAAHRARPSTAAVHDVDQRPQPEAGMPGGQPQRNLQIIGSQHQDHQIPTGRAIPGTQQARPLPERRVRQSNTVVGPAAPLITV